MSERDEDGFPTGGELSLSRESAEELFKEVARLGELKGAGVLTDEEFQKKLDEIRRSVAGNLDKEPPNDPDDAEGFPIEPET